VTNGEPVIAKTISSTAPADASLPGSRACCALLFDFGGTLDADGETWKDRMRRLYAEAGLQVAPARFDPAFHRADDALVGSLPASCGFAETAHRLVAGLHRALGLAPDARAEAIAGRFAGEALGQVRRRGALLRSLAGRYRLGIVSNFYGNLEAICEEAGLRSGLGAIVDSQVVGFTKPDPRIFQAALSTLGVSAAEALFVGDSLARDMEGARAVGMPHLWLAPAGGATCCPGDRVIRSLDELEAHLP